MKRRGFEAAACSCGARLAGRAELAVIVDSAIGAFARATKVGTPEPAISNLPDLVTAAYEMVRVHVLLHHCARCAEEAIDSAAETLAARAQEPSPETNEGEPG